VSKTKIIRIAGFIIIGIAVIGFMTVADEFHHMGELIGVSGVLISGIFLVVAGYKNSLTRLFALQWVPVGIGIGLITGAAIDNMLIGLIGGILTGLIIAYFARPREI
jgi:hypothetical protein